MQPPQDGACDRRYPGGRFGRGRALEPGDDEPQVVENAPAVGTLRHVALES
jgi:hypothetical protein